MPTEPALVLALRDYMEGRTDKAIERIKDLDPANLEILLRLMPAVALAYKADLSGRTPSDAAVLASQLEAAADAAAKLTPLKIRKACFVWRVAQFGVYEPVPENHPFLPGGSGVLYLELQNAPSLPTDELPAGGKGFVTRLAVNTISPTRRGSRSPSRGRSITPNSPAARCGITSSKSKSKCRRRRGITLWWSN